jgi:adenylate cyclase
MQELESGLAARLAAAVMGATNLNNYLAEACLMVSDIPRGLRAVDDALQFARDHEELAWEGESLRLRAELLLRQAELDPAGAVGAKIEAEECALEALRRGRAQSAKMFELRAALVLHRIYRDQGKAREAHDMLAQVYDWFDGAEDVPDLAAAAALLRGSRRRDHP